jgi:hypothetical protein
LPPLSDDEFDGTLLNALFVAREKYLANITELNGLPDKDTPAVKFLVEQFRDQATKVDRLMDKLQEESTDA